MTDREKLIELLNEVADNAVNIPTDGFIAYLADHLIANGVTFAKDTDVPSKWISVEDDLPKGDCFVYEANSGNVYRGCGAEVLAAADWNVTHWMPMPDPPKEEPR